VKLSWLFANDVAYKQVLCECEGDPVYICINTTAMVQDKSGWTTCTAPATSIHWWNVDTAAGAFITVIAGTVETCQSSVIMVSTAAGKFSDSCLKVRQLFDSFM